MIFKVVFTPFDKFIPPPYAADSFSDIIPPVIFISISPQLFDIPIPPPVDFDIFLLINPSLIFIIEPFSPAVAICIPAPFDDVLLVLLFLLLLFDCMLL